MVHFVVFFAMSVLLLMPYWLLRPAMRPWDEWVLMGGGKEKRITHLGRKQVLMDLRKP